MHSTHLQRKTVARLDKDIEDQIQSLLTRRITHFQNCLTLQSADVHIKAATADKKKAKSRR